MSEIIFDLIKQEEERQQKTLMMIPSENITSPAVRRAVGSVMMHKYSEGQINKRYYQGNEYIDEIERICKERALQAFELDASEWGVNVQILSGSGANLAVYSALLQPGDTIMAMYLPEGGHLSHGWHLPNKPISFTSKIWKFEFYHVNPETHVFDYNELQQQVSEIKPKLIVSGGTAYPREIDHKRMAEIAHSVGAYYLADIAHEAGLVAGKANASPFPHADIVTMTTHKTLRGPRGAMIFSKRQETHNKQHGNQTLPELIDFSVFPGLQGGPHNEKIAGLAVALGEVLQPEFREYAQQVVVNAKVLVEALTAKGYTLVSGGTDKHLLLIDLSDRDLSGWVVAWALEAAGIIVNRNTVPNESASPFYPSGVRIGTPAITSRGMKEPEMKQIAEWIDQVIQAVSDQKLPSDKDKRAEFVKHFPEWVKRNEVINAVRQEVEERCEKFPIPKS